MGCTEVLFPKPSPQQTVPGRDTQSSSQPNGPETDPEKTVGLFPGEMPPYSPTTKPKTLEEYEHVTAQAYGRRGLPWGPLVAGATVLSSVAVLALFLKHRAAKAPIPKGVQEEILGEIPKILPPPPTAEELEGYFNKQTLLDRKTKKPIPLTNIPLTKAEFFKNRLEILELEKTIQMWTGHKYPTGTDVIFNVQSELRKTMGMDRETFARWISAGSEKNSNQFYFKAGKFNAQNKDFSFLLNKEQIAKIKNLMDDWEKEITIMQDFKNQLTPEQIKYLGELYNVKIAFRQAISNRNGLNLRPLVSF